MKEVVPTQRAEREKLGQNNTLCYDVSLTGMKTHSALKKRKEVIILYYILHLLYIFTVYADRRQRGEGDNMQ